MGLILMIISREAHIPDIKKNVSSSTGVLKRVRPFVSMLTAVKIHKNP